MRAESGPEAPRLAGELGAAFAFALIVAAGLLLADSALFRAPLYETLDIAANSLLVQDAKRLELLTGAYSRFGFFHPGPVYFYVLATGEVLFHDLLRWVQSPVAGQVIAAALMNAAWMGTLAWILIRTFASAIVGLAAAAALLAVTGLREPQYLTNLWFPYLNYLPFAVFTACVGRLSLGRLDALGLSCVSAAVLVHAHISFVAITAVMLAGAMLVQGASARSRGEPWWPGIERELRAHRRQLLFCAAVAVAFAVPIALHSFLHPPGEIPKYFGHRLPGNPWLGAWAYVAQFWGGAGMFPLAAGIVAMAILCAVRVTRSLAIGALLATMVTLLYAKVAVDDLTLPFFGFHYFAAIGLTAAAAAGWAIVLLEPRWRLAGFAVLVVAGIVAALHLRPSLVWPSPHIPFITQELLRAPRKPVILDLDTARNWELVWGHAVGAAADWVRRGERVACIRAGWHILFTRRLQCSEAEARSGSRFFLTGQPLPPSEEDGVVALGDLRLVRLAPRATPRGATVMLTSANGLELQRHLRGGGSPEPNFTWSVGPRMSLDFVIPEPGAFTLEFDIAFSAVPESPSIQRAAIAVNGRPVGILEFGRDSTHGLRSVDVPEGLVGPDGSVLLELGIETPFSPASVGRSADTRQLGVAVRSVRVLAPRSVSS